VFNISGAAKEKLNSSSKNFAFDWRKAEVFVDDISNDMLKGV
jgi:hypothetical protein